MSTAMYPNKSSRKRIWGTNSRIMFRYLRFWLQHFARVIFIILVILVE